MATAVKRPAFQFYPDKWQSDKDLRRCSIGARGLWMELCCVMHTCAPYGNLTENDGSPMDDKDAAQLCGVDLRTYRTLLAELERKGVPSRTAAGVLHSRRMVRDEQVRNARAEGGKDGAEFGALGKVHGKKGGRPRKQSGDTTGDKKPPLHQERKPPPVSVVASASASPPVGLENHNPQPLSPGVAARPAVEPGMTVPTWEAYAEAYEARYGLPPVRNATVNGQLANVVKRLGAEAPAVARFYVGHNAHGYVKGMHQVGLLLHDAEKLRTEWATNRRVTDTQARQADRRQSTGDVVAELIAEARNGTQG